MAEQGMIKSTENGPYLVTGDVTITDHDGASYEIKGTTAALCRCGHSSNKPFCDGSHTAEDFRATERAAG